MSADRSATGTKERDLFLEALERPTPAARTAFLDEACADNTALRAAVEALLANHQPDGFLERPAVETPTRTESDETRGASEFRALATEKAGDRIGHYRLLQEIGEGGCGTVYMAEQEEPVRRRVALKIIKLGMDTKSVIARFEAERQALAMMDHPNIAKVLDAGATNTGRPYFVMELVRGIRITDFCDQNHLSTRDRLKLFIQVCQAIQHAHQKGVIHRDIKPSNILVTLHDGVPVPKVIDFGIAKATDQRLTDKTLFTHFHAFIGTPAYTSPEQAEMSGLDVDTRTDIYSLGVLLYEMLTGKTPFDAKQLAASSLEEMRRTIREKEPLRPSTRLLTMLDSEATTTAQRQQSEPARLASVLRGDLDWVVMKALEKDRTRRYDTANALAMDVQRYLNDEPILARPPSNLDRLQKMVRRHKALFASGAAVTAALVLGVIVSSWQAVRATLAEQEQSHLKQVALDAQAAEANLRRVAEAEGLRSRQKAYAADMNLVQQALAANNLGRAQQLLDAQIPRSGQPDLRGWEWRYLWQHCQSDALFTLCQQTNEIHALAVSFDGRWVALAETSGDLSVWDLRTRQPLARLPGAGPGRPSIAASPVAPLLAVGVNGFGPRPEARPRVRLWSPESGRFESDLNLPAPVSGIAFSADGQTLAVATTAGALFWNVADPAKPVPLPTSGLSEPPKNPLHPPGFGLPGGAQFSRDLKLLATPLPGGVIRVTDAQTGEEKWSATAADERVTALAFSPDGKLLASGAGFVESAIRLWDVATGAEMGRLDGHRTWVSALLFWPDGDILASASADQTINLWDVANLRSLPFRPELGRPAEPRAGDRPRPEMLRRGRPPRPFLFRLPPYATLRGHKLEVWSLALLPDRTTLISGSKDGSVYVWDTATQRRDKTRISLPEPVRGWAFAPDSRSILGMNFQGLVKRWSGPEFQDGETVLETGPGATNLAFALFSPDGHYLAALDKGQGLRIWDLAQRAFVRQLGSERDWALPIGFLGQAGELLTAAQPGDRLVAWNLAAGTSREVWRSADAAPRGLRLVRAVSADGQWLAQCGDDGIGQLVNLTTGAPQPLELGLRQISYCAFAPDNSMLVGVSRLGMGNSVVWDVPNARRIAILQGFLQGASSAAFSPDARRLAIGSDGNEAIKLWDMASLQELLTLEGQGSAFASVTFSPDGNSLGSSNSQGLLQIWTAPSWKQVAAAGETK